jgi:L-fuculokinase
MVRSSASRSDNEQLKSGITTELDVKPGLFNIGSQWIASGILEWAKKTLYPDIKKNIYEVMIKGASLVPSGSMGIKVNPRFCEESNGFSAGAISGITLNTTRDEIFRAMLEALSLRLKEGISALEKAGGFKTNSLLCVGGGSKNDLWNQLRANTSGVPVIVTDKTETTVLGASLFVQYAAGNASSPDEARAVIDYKKRIFEPGK